MLYRGDKLISVVGGEGMRPLAETFKLHNYNVTFVSLLSDLDSSAAPDVILVDDQILDENASRWYLENDSNADVLLIMNRWIDLHSYLWSTEILKIKLILHCPVDPGLLLYEVDRLLNAYRCETSTCSEVAVEAEASPIAQVKAKLRADVQAQWKNLILLAEPLSSIQSEVTKELVSQTHKLRGSAGSLGLTGMSRAAATIEQHLRMFSDKRSYSERLLIKEIQRLFRAGADETGTVALDDDTAGDADEAGVLNLLVLADPGRFEAVNDALTSRNGVAATMASDPFEALAMALAGQFDGFLIETFFDKQLLFELCRNIRITAGNEAIPFVLCMQEPMELSAAELTYLGASDIVYGDFLEQLNKSVSSLIELSYLFKPALLEATDYTGRNAELVGTKVRGTIPPIEMLNCTVDTDSDGLLLHYRNRSLIGSDIINALRSRANFAQVPIALFVNQREYEILDESIGYVEHLFVPETDRRMISELDRILHCSRLERQNPSIDPSSGMLKRPAFLERSLELFSRSNGKGCQFALVFLSVEGPEHLSVGSILARLLNGRFSAQCVRGVLEDTFGLAVFLDRSDEIDGAIKLLQDEIYSCVSNDIEDLKVDIQVNFAIAKFPQDGNIFSDLVEKIERKLGASTSD
ncbi:MAG: Hpt domain-containing protein [Candidatus Obscuribacterales bacterium]|nr:Hpt domain-containing protein [Candidatus Obscuribacterales bacterium]